MVVLILFVILGVVCYYYHETKWKKAHTYWKNKNVAQLNPVFFYGDAKDTFKRKISASEQHVQFYKKFKQMGVPYGGVYVLTRKAWVPIDPKIIKTILTKDFHYFSAHHIMFSKTLFFNNLFHMDGDEWKDWRRKLTPTFTSGKMKMMFDTVLEKSNELVNLVDKMVTSGQCAEIKELLARFTTDVIGSCGFGIECNSMENVDSEFFKHGQMIFKTDDMPEPSIFRLLLIFLGIVARFRPLDFTHVENFFRQAVNETLKYREENKVFRKDFMHLMIQLKNKGMVTELTNENEDVYKKTVEKDAVTVEDITGQCLLFFTAGFETSSTTMSFALLELTQHQEVQQKLRKEIREVLKRHNGKLSYEAIQEMKYCDNVIQETLRMYPPLAVLPRLCTKDYTIPGTDIVIEKGTSASIPVFALHRDPEYFPEPDKFIPERFSPENKDKIREFTYMPFGEGPRQCLGLRFGMMQSKLGLATLINKFNFTLNKKSSYPPEYDKKAFLLSVDGGIWLDAQKVN